MNLDKIVKFYLILSCFIYAIVIPVSGELPAISHTYPQSTNVSNKTEVPSSVSVPTKHPGYAPDRVIVRYKNGTSSRPVFSTEQVSLNDKVGASVLKKGDNKEFPKNTELVELPVNTSVNDAIVMYEADPLVAYAEPDYILECVDTPVNASGVTPNDPYFSYLYGMQRISAPDAWDYTTGSSDVIVAVIDTGVNYNHPDLSANMWTDSNGYHGYDFVNNDNYPLDDNGHGTHCAGTVAAVGNNAVGVTGVAWTSKIMALKTLDSSGSGYSSDATSAILYAENHGASILSCSWGGSDSSQTLQDAIRASSALIVCAAGNYGRNTDILPFYPASYQNENIISVAATTSGDTLSSYSDYGASSVDVAAPGDNIYSTSYTGSYTYKTGTSMATPHVAGLAVLIRSLDRTLSAGQIKSVIIQNVDTLAGLSGKCVSGGRINAAHAVASIHEVPLHARFYGVPGIDVFPLTIQFYDDSDGDPETWYWDFGDGNYSTEQNPRYTYTAPGDYLVNLTITRE